MSDQIIGALPTATIAASALTQGGGFGLGDRRASNGKEWVYVQADGAITGDGYVCQIDENYQAVMVSTSVDAIGDLIGVANVAFADNDYGWLQVRGPCVARVAASCGANVLLNSTATAGQIDDDGGSTGMAIQGLVLTTANGGSAGTAAAMLNYPVIASVGSIFTDGVTPGTAASGKALVLGSSGEIATITTATITTLTTGAIAGADSSLGITGQAAAQGGDVVSTGGTSSTSGNAGGAAKLVGGTPGATGVGGAAEVTGAAGGATSGTGGQVTLTAGAGTAGNANGGSVVIAAGAAHGSGANGVIVERSVKLVKQGAQTAKSVSATLTAAEVLAGIITVNQAAGATSAQQLPLASAMDTALPAAAADDAFDFSVINISTVDAEDASITTNTGWTLVGNMDIHAYSAAGSLNSSARFRARKTGSAAWTLYRIS